MEKVPMGPPRPRNPSTAAAPPDSTPPNIAHDGEAESRSVADGDPTTKHEVVPPSVKEEEEAATATATETETATAAPSSTANSESQERPPSPPPLPPSRPSPSPASPAVPYSIPPWSERPQHPFYLEVLKDGTIVDKLHVSGKGAYMFGRTESCDFVLEHPSISRYHTVLQYGRGSEVFIYDIGSTHGTSINKKEVKKKVYVEVHVGDVIRFGHSSRLYIFQGPPDLMPAEVDLDLMRKKKLQEELQDREASLLRAKVEASLANGISWGMAEDAIEDTIENDADEITWQAFKGQLTERQEKTRGKIIKRMEKVANMRKEIGAIRAKDIAQGGLTQGQQTQIARNEQRMQQIMEELDSLEETLNESIRESVGARVRKAPHAKKTGHNQDEDEDDFLSDDDEFYDRTKRKSSLRQYNEKQSVQIVETADTLLDKKYAIIKEMEDKTNLLQKEKGKAASVRMMGEVDDALDAYMSDLSSELATDTCMKVQEEISILQAELDRIQYLLKIADPTGEAARKKDATSVSSEPRDENDLNIGVNKKKTSEETKTATLENAAKFTLSVEDKRSLSKQEDVPEKEPETAADRQKDGPKEVPEKKVYTAIKPQWLGAAREVTPMEDHTDKGAPGEQGLDQFIDYKDRKKALAPISNKLGEEDSGSGLIIRKRKDREEPEAASRLVDRELASTSSEVETRAEDAVALLLRHKRGYYGAERELQNEALPGLDGDGMQKNSQEKRVLGPAKPDFLYQKDYESWVPPEGQSGDGRTSLNEKLGY